MERVRSDALPAGRRFSGNVSNIEPRLTGERGMLTTSQPSNRLSSAAASGPAYPAIWAGASYVRGLCSSRTDADSDTPAALPGLPKPHDSGPRRGKLRRSQSANLRMLQVRERPQNIHGRSDEISQVAAEGKRARKRPQHGGANRGRHSSDMMSGHHIRSPSPSHPGYVRSRQALTTRAYQRLRQTPPPQLPPHPLRPRTSPMIISSKTAPTAASMICETIPEPR